MTKSDKDNPGFDTQQLGRNDHPVTEKPKLADSKIFPGVKSVQPDDEGRFESRTGSAGSGHQ